MLYLVATPIGNLKDITLRALEVLKSADCILAEDTRTTSYLLKYFSIEKPLISFESFSEARKEEEMVRRLKNNETLALVSEAGTPCICDPGHRLVKRCRKEGIKVSAIPGSAAFVMAYSLIGSDRPFQFIGFFPKEKSALLALIESFFSYPGITIGYESPKRIKKTLSLLPSETKVYIGRELTKIFEEVLEGSAAQLLEHFTHYEPKGEFVLLIEPQMQKPSTKKGEILAKKLVDEYHLTTKNAAKLASELTDVSKNFLYDFLLNQ